MHYCIVSIGYNNTCMLVVDVNKQGVKVLDANVVKSSDCFSFGSLEDAAKLVARIKNKLLGEIEIKCESLVIVLGQDMCHSTYIDAFHIEGKPKQKLKKVKEIANGKRHTGFTLTELLRLGENDTREIYQWTECHNRTIDKFINVCFQENLPVSYVLSSTYSLHHFNRSVPCNFEVVSDSEENKMVKGATFMIEVGVTSTKYTIVHNNLPLESRDSKFNMSSVVNALSNCSKSFYDTLLQLDDVGFLKPNKTEDEGGFKDDDDFDFSLASPVDMKEIKDTSNNLFYVDDSVELFDDEEDSAEELFDAYENGDYEEVYDDEEEADEREDIDIDLLDEEEPGRVQALVNALTTKIQFSKKKKERAPKRQKESLNVTKEDKYLDAQRIDEQDFNAHKKKSMDNFSENDMATYTRYMEVITAELSNEINENLTGMSNKYNVPIQKFYISCPDIKNHQVLVEDIEIVNSSLNLEPGYDLYYENFTLTNETNVTLTQMFALCVGGAVSLTVKGCDMYEE